MVNLTQARMWTVTDAKSKLNALVNAAQNGQITHIVSGAQVAAHIVPASTWIMDDEIALRQLLAALIAQEAQLAAEGSLRSGGPFTLAHAGDVLGRVLGWAWRTDPDKLFVRAMTQYTQVLSELVGQPLAFQDVRDGLEQCLGGGVFDRSEIAAAMHYAQTHWDDWM